MSSHVYRTRVARLRQELASRGLAAYLVPGTDPHQSEYVPDCWQRRRWLSGFTGSAGDVIVTRKRAVLFTDGRYALQAERELAGSGIETVVLTGSLQSGISSWIGRHVGRGEALGVDPQLLTPAAAEELERALIRPGARLVFQQKNLVDAIWSDRPGLPEGPITVHPPRWSGESTAAKLRRLRRTLAQEEADVYVLSGLDEIAWLFNVRGMDIAYNPLVIAYALVTRDRALLFCQPEKLRSATRRRLGQQVELYPYGAFGAALAGLGKRRAGASDRRPVVWLDERQVSAWTLAQLRRCPLKRAASPVRAMKARKNSVELAGMRAAHQRDGVALVRFFAWLERTVAHGQLTELAAAERLRELRAEGEHFRGESFAPIVAYGPHGAIVHYSASPETNAPLSPAGLLLVDSGGQYLDGTTDVTRTVLLGARATPAQRARFTQVLKGHIALARAHFPRGTTGQQLDALARAPLWRNGYDYQHGTGHGVGAYLGVHEGPQAISKRAQTAALEPGNVLSDEPGYYEPGVYGIRIENLFVVQEVEGASADGCGKTQASGGPFLCFDVLTLCPIDTRLVDRALLDRWEGAWLDSYHARVRRELSPLLAADDRAWLAQATSSRTPEC